MGTDNRYREVMCDSLRVVLHTLRLGRLLEVSDDRPFLLPAAPAAGQLGLTPSGALQNLLGQYYMHAVQPIALPVFQVRAKRAEGEGEGPEQK